MMGPIDWPGELSWMELVILLRSVIDPPDLCRVDTKVATGQVVNLGCCGDGGRLA
jgi:hypothetical protein